MRALFAAILLSATVATALASPWNAQSRWEFISGDDDMGAYLAYLREYPDSPHVPEARRRLVAFENTPLARLDTPACAATLQARAEKMLAAALQDPARANHDAVVPEGYFLGSPTLVVVPRGQTLQATPIEDQLFLTLIASKSGGCTLMQRWSHGSGLPEECRCSPIDPGFRFPSALAQSVLADYVRFQSLNRVCVARGAPDQSADIEALLDASVARWEARAASIRARAAAGRPVLPTQEGEAEDIEHALIAMRGRDVPWQMRARQDGAVAAMSPDQLDGLCGGRLTGLLQQAREAVGRVQTLDP
jgi:hypothetical protein